MTYVTAEFGRPVMPPKPGAKPTTIGEYLARYGEAELGRMMCDMERKRAPRMPDATGGTKGRMADTCRRVGLFVEDVGEVTAQDVADGLDISIDHARLCLRDLYKAGEVKRRAVLPKGAHSRHYVWSLVEVEE